MVIYVWCRDRSYNEPSVPEHGLVARYDVWVFCHEYLIDYFNVEFYLLYPKYPFRVPCLLERGWVNKFKREIITVLLVKVILIFGIWSLFFSHPVDKTLTSEGVGSAILGAASNNKGDSQ